VSLSVSLSHSLSSYNLPRICIDDEMKTYPPVLKMAFFTEKVPTISFNYIYYGEKSFAKFRVTSIRPGFGGTRMLFLCPICQKRVRHLYFNIEHGIKYWRCRHCLNLRYPCQLKHRKRIYELSTKFIHKQNKIGQRLSNKWLRKPTRARLQQELERIGQEAYRKNEQYWSKKRRK